MLLLLPLLILACLALPLLISLASNIWRNLHVLRAVPGPQSVFSLRTLLLGVFGDGTLGEAGMPLRHRTYATLQKSYGPIMRICISPLFARMAVLVCDPAEPIPKWMSRADSDRGNFWHSVQLHRSIFALPMGPDWARHRKLIAPLFSVKSLTTFVPQIHAISRALLLLWAAAATERAERKVTCEMHAALSAWSLDIIGRVIFDHDFEAVHGLHGTAAGGGAAAADGAAAGA